MMTSQKCFNDMYSVINKWIKPLGHHIVKPKTIVRLEISLHVFKLYSVYYNKLYETFAVLLFSTS